MFQTSHRLSSFLPGLPRLGAFQAESSLVARKWKTGRTATEIPKEMTNHEDVRDHREPDAGNHVRFQVRAFGAAGSTNWTDAVTRMAV